MTTFFRNHLNDLKLHLLLGSLVTLAVFSISLYYIDQWLYVCLHPLICIKQSNYFIVTDLMEIFALKLTLAGLIGLGGGLLGLLLQGWIFLAPGLYKHENKCICQIFLLGGIGFGVILYGVITYLLPHLWWFFYTYEKTNHPFLFNLYLEPRLSTYVFFLLHTVGWIVLLLHYPLLLFGLLYFQWVDLEQVTRFRKILYLKLLVLASLMAPPEVSSQLLLFGVLVSGLEGMLCGFYILRHRV